MSKLHIQKLEVGFLATNCYILDTKDHCCIIDPGENGSEIIKKCGKNSIDLILLTHEHYDHIGAVEYIRERTDAKLYCSAKCSLAIQNPGENFSYISGQNLVCKEADECRADLDTIQFEDFPITVRETPGHAPGSLSYIIENHVFTGDLIFRESVGRTDFPGGSFEVLKKSILEKIFILDDDCIIYPGHGPQTSVGFEKVNNRYIA